jgi:hypothetical protein
MQEMTPDFTTIMSWLILFLNSVVAVLLGLEVRRLQQARLRALLGLIGMSFVLVATVASLFGFAAHRAHSPRHSPLSSQLLLPLVASVLMVSLIRLSFPPLAPGLPLSRTRHLLLLLLTFGCLLGASGFVVLDLLFS